MKAVSMYKPGDLRVEEVPLPIVQPDEVMVKVRAVGLCGSDIPRALTYGAHISPIIIGHEFSGEITELGADIESFKVGDRVVDGEKTLDLASRLEAFHLPFSSPGRPVRAC